MGVWSTPHTDTAMRLLEGLMERPLPARNVDMLYNLTGDDTLFDMVAARGNDDDVRPLVAMTLDEWVNWTSPEAFSNRWPADVVERGRALVDRFADTPLDQLSSKPLSDGSPDAAARNIGAMLTGEQPSRVDPSRYEVAPGFAPGTHVVRDPASGKTFRFEHVYGVVFEAAPGTPAADANPLDRGTPSP